MNNNMTDFIHVNKMAEEVCQKYSGKIPDELLSIWRDYGIGGLLNGYLKIINPDDFQDILEETYFRSDVSIAIFATSFDRSN
ncbi:GAD-like domain-containing protein [Listeria booriae]|uniref:GAD-related domain-containing protein n=1 Tax=Listeria booriae TaxID=1552123 RepID=A0A7X0XV37_9LIST|nr:GAD-like domain-containing protein [Listeria booriae]MBC1791872.1 hypothetical protein [Listeria booriae]